MPAVISQTESDKYDVYITDALENFEVYAPVYELLVKSKSSTTITFYLATTGGSEQTANLLRALIGKSKAATTAVIVGDMADQGLIFLDAFDSVAAFPEAVLVFSPTYLTVANEDVGRIQEFNQGWTPLYYRSRYSKFLPAAEITTKLLAGVSVVITGQQLNENITKLKR